MTEIDPADLMTHDDQGPQDTEPMTPVQPSEVQPPTDYHEDGEWAGHTRYACNHCRYDTVSEGDIKRHVQQHFIRRPRATIYGPDGQPV